MQRSPLSDELQEVYTTQGREAFFIRLGRVRQSDADVEAFIGSLSVADREIARGILASVSGESQLDARTREQIPHVLGDYMADAGDDFTLAVTWLERDLRAEAQASADLANAIFSMVFAFVVPGLGKWIARAADKLRIGASNIAYRTALFAQDQAEGIAGTIGEGGKFAAQKAVKENFSPENPRSFFNALREAWQAGKNQILTHVRLNTEAYPDYVLLIYLATWKGVTADMYYEMLRKKWDAYSSQVLAIGDVYGHVEFGQFRPATSISSTRLVRVRSSRGGSQLANVLTYRISPFFSTVRWLAAVSPEFEEMALERARRMHGGVRSMDASEIRGVPSRYR